MKETDKRKDSNNKEKSSPARPESRNHKLQGKNGGRNLRATEIDSKHSSDKQEVNKFVSDLKSGAECPEVYDSMVIDHVDDVFRSEEALDSSKTGEMDDKLGNEKLNDNSSDMDIADESDPETINDSVSSQGDPQTADEEKAQNVRVTKKSAKGNLTDGCSHAPRVRPDEKTNSVQSKASKATPKKGAKPEKVPPKSTAKGSSVNSKNVKIHPKPQSYSLDGADVRPLEQLKGVEILDEAPNSAHSVCSDDEVITNGENDNQEENAALDQKIEEMETRIKNLESELREVAALEIALYSIVPEHGSSAHKVHTPARRLSRLYIYACKYWSQDRRATVSKNMVSQLVLVFKSCGNDVPRLTFWLSNTVALRDIISQAFGSSCHSSALAKAFESQDGEKSETKSSSVKRRTSVGNRQLNKQSFLQFVDDWQETRTFTAALEKVESWIFSRIVDSIWWQTLAPNMQSPAGDSSKKKGAERLLGPALGDQKQGSFSINLWRNAFHDALKRLCPVRAGGHECGCLPVLPRKVMEQCIGRLDVAMFNAILRESAHEIPTDPVSDPIVDSKVLPIPAGDLSFGSGAQLKNSVGNWVRWLDDFLGMDTDSSSKDENDEKGDTREPKSFPLLNDLSDLLMLPKDMLMDRTIRMEVCPSISLPLVKRVLCNFTPDEFCPDPVPGAVLEALNAESIIERRLSVESNNNSFPYSAAPVVYTPPSTSDVAEKVAEAGANSQMSRSASSVQRKGYTTDEELDELECCLTCIIDKFPSSPTAVVNRRNGNGDSKEEVGYNNGDNARYDLLREVWRSG